ncbi:MAG: filamentous hemagglutinin N-terminal domain-containing protein [Pseudomonadota bacterium]
MAASWRSTLIALCTFLTCTSALANPSGADIAHGVAQLLRPHANALHIKTRGDTIINWRDFSIGQNEITRFLQSHASDRVLNRVIGQLPSQILGQLISNGRIFLINPHGIVTGAHARIDTAGFIASSLNISDRDFLNRHYRFDGGPNAGDVVNHGLVKTKPGGEVVLIAPTVENHGVISAPDGQIMLVAGRRVRLTSLDLDGIFVEVSAPDDKALNLGTLIAERGAIGMFSRSLRNTGRIEANSVALDDEGRVVLRADGDITLSRTSHISADGARGGEVSVRSTNGTVVAQGSISANAREHAGGKVELLGERVAVFHDTDINANGDRQGGTVFIGGGGVDDLVTPRAQQTYVSPTASVQANARTFGNGGTIIAWANESLGMHGALSARGGQAGGNGGFIETSALFGLDITQAPDVAAPRGDGGVWLIDPYIDLFIRNDGSPDIDSGMVSSVPEIWESCCTGPGTLSWATLAASLTGGQTVIVQNGSGGGGPGNVYFDGAIAIDVGMTSGTNTLVVNAGDNIEFNANFVDPAGGSELNLVLNADALGPDGVGSVIFAQDLYTTGNLTTTGNDVYVTNNGRVTLDGGVWNDNTNLGITIGAGVGDGHVQLFNANLYTAAIELGVSAVNHGALHVHGGVVKTSGWDNHVWTLAGTADILVDQGGLLETHLLEIGKSGAASLLVTGPGSLVRATPENGGSSAYPNLAGYVRAGKLAGSDGHIEVVDGAKLEIVDGIEPNSATPTHGPTLELGSHKGAHGSLSVDHAGVLVRQSAPENAAGAPVAPGPLVIAGGRGSGVIELRSDSTFLVDGPFPELIISTEAQPLFSSDPTGPIYGQGVVDIFSGSEFKLRGPRAHALIGTGGPSADGILAVSGPGSRFIVEGFQGTLVSGDFGLGRAGSELGGLIDTEFAVVGRKPTSDGGLGAQLNGLVNVQKDLIAGKDFSLNTFDVTGLGGAAQVLSFDGGVILFSELCAAPHAEVHFGANAGPAQTGLIGVANEAIKVGDKLGVGAFKEAKDPGADGEGESKEDSPDTAGEGDSLRLNEGEALPEPKPGICA